MNFIKKGVRFLKSYTKWVLAGKPLRSDKYIFELYDICKNCPSNAFIQFKENEGTCDECDCRIKRISASEDDLNKLAWPTEKCPLNHWKSDVDEPTDAKE